MANAVSTRVYQSNPTGFIVIGVWIVCIFIAIPLVHNMSTIPTFILFMMFVAVPVYVKYGNNEKIKMRNWDERRLVFSSNGIDFGDTHYSISKIESAAVYLDSFNGFQFRTMGEPGVGGSQGRIVERDADGDNNKISVRYDGNVEDFSFYLANYTQFAMFKEVMNEWVSGGVNVVIKQQFEDATIVEEMQYFGTPKETL
jgi:hypothetical protein